MQDPPQLLLLSETEGYHQHVQTCTKLQLMQGWLQQTTGILTLLNLRMLLGTMQADRRALNITLNSIGTELTRDDRRKLYSNFGLLYPHGHYELAGAEDFDQIRSAMEKCPPYQAIFTKVCTSGPCILAPTQYSLRRPCCNGICVLHSVLLPQGFQYH